jgi:hypothetical protein
VLDPAAGVGGWVRPQLSGGCPALTVSWRACACVSLCASELTCACNKKSSFSLFVTKKNQKLLRAVMKSTVHSCVACSRIHRHGASTACHHHFHHHHHRRPPPPSPPLLLATRHNKMPITIGTAIHPSNTGRHTFTSLLRRRVPRRWVERAESDRVRISRVLLESGSQRPARGAHLDVE